MAWCYDRFQYKEIYQPNAIINDDTLFSDFLYSKNIDKKIKINLKKIETKYSIRILFGDKIADIAEKMHNYLPF